MWLRLKFYISPEKDFNFGRKLKYKDIKCNREELNQDKFDNSGAVCLLMASVLNESLTSRINN